MMTKTLEIHVFRHFLGYGTVCHRYIGKVTKFGHSRIIFFKRHYCFSVEGGEKGKVLTISLIGKFMAYATRCLWNSEEGKYQVL